MQVLSAELPADERAVRLSVANMSITAVVHQLILPNRFMCDGHVLYGVMQRES
jgi:hypothetical protein